MKKSAFEIQKELREITNVLQQLSAAKRRGDIKKQGNKSLETMVNFCKLTLKEYLKEVNSQKTQLIQELKHSKKELKHSKKELKQNEKELGQLENSKKNNEDRINKNNAKINEYKKQLQSKKIKLGLKNTKKNKNNTIDTIDTIVRKNNVRVKRNAQVAEKTKKLEQGFKETAKAYTLNNTT